MERLLGRMEKRNMKKKRKKEINGKKWIRKKGRNKRKGKLNKNQGKKEKKQ